MREKERANENGGKSSIATAVVTCAIMLSCVLLYFASKHAPINGFAYANAKQYPSASPAPWYEEALVEATEFENAVLKEGIALEYHESDECAAAIISVDKDVIIPPDAHIALSLIDGRVTEFTITAALSPPTGHKDESVDVFDGVLIELEASAYDDALDAAINAFKRFARAFDRHGSLTHGDMGAFDAVIREAEADKKFMEKRTEPFLLRVTGSGVDGENLVISLEYTEP